MQERYASRLKARRMNLAIFALACFSFFQITICSEQVIGDGTFREFWYKNVYNVFGTGESFNVKGDGYRTCSSGKELETWLVTQTLSINRTLNDVKLYIEIESQMEKCDNKNGNCFKDAFELFRYNDEGTPEVPFALSISNFEEEKKKARAFFQRNFTYIGNITGNSTSKEIMNTTFILNFKQFRTLTLGIKSRGSCGTVSRMKVYYIVCQETFIDSVMFVETLAPQNGSKVVFGNCSANSRNNFTRGNLKAFCHSNGSWITDGKIVCSCEEGYESTDERGCSRCQNGWYKSSVSNEKCNKCPRNTVSAKNNTTCICKDGHYKLPRYSKTPRECYAPIKIPEKPVVSRIKGSKDSVNITWLPPINNSGIDETVVYDIVCNICAEIACNKSCGGDVCSKPCADLSYSPSQHNVTETRIRVSGLVNKKSYQFKIVAKNSLNRVVPRKKWKFVSSDPYMFSSKEDQNENDGKKKDDDDKFTFLVIIVCVGSLTVLLAVFLVAFCLRKRKEKKGLFEGLVANGVELPTAGTKTYIDPTNYDKPEDAICEFALEIDATRLYLEMLIGGGEFGDVYKGSMTDDDGRKHPVAVKTLKKDATAKSERDFLMEASVMGQFNCPNVIKLEGVVTKYRPWMIIIEFMANGSLDNFLKANDGRLSHLELITMAKGVAVGMEYLAGMKFVHRDLAARNVLVDGNLVCKVCDFGLSRELETTDSSRGEYATTGGKIPIRWTAPEATKYRKFSSASDVWSFGILLWEIMSFAERPYWEWDNFRVMEEVDNGFRLPAPLNCPKAVHDLMTECWKKERIERPTFSEINVVLDGWIQAPKTMEGNVDLSAALREWLESIKMGEYVSNFTTAGYQRPCELIGIKEDDLKEMGISLVGHRNKILKGIKNLHGKKKGAEKLPLQREISLEV